VSVLEHARAGKPEGYRSDNQSKWEFRNGLYQKHLELYLDGMYRHLRESGAKRVLDAGCGEGIVYRAMRERGYDGQWVGFDFSRAAVEMARRGSPEAAWIHASAYELPFADGSFDLLFSSQVLEHLPDPVKPLRQYARVSRRWLLLSVPLEPLFRRLTWWSQALHVGGDPGHVNFWRPREFRSFVGHAGQICAWERTTVYQIALVTVAAGGCHKCR
jgi:SAM-dependent methyltransferase